MSIILGTDHPITLPSEFLGAISNQKDLTEAQSCAVQRCLDDETGFGPPLESIFTHHEGRLVDKWTQYFDIYERHFARFRGKPVRILEIGVSQGGSLQLWREYFGENAEIVGIDIDERCQQFEEPGTRVIIGDQADRRFLKWLKSQEAPFDIIIDDGGHLPKQQINSFEELYKHTTENGVYLVEDVHTSYWRGEWQGGLRKNGTFIEYAKMKIDELNGEHVHMGAGVTPFTYSTNAMHFYDSVVVFEKTVRQKARRITSGTPSF